LLVRIVPLINTRIKKLTEATPFIDFMFSDIAPPARDMLIGPKMEQHLSLHALRASKSLIEGLPQFDETALETAFRELGEELQLKPAQLFTIVRNAVSGKSVTPPLFGTMVVLGRQTVLKRLAIAEQVLSA
jgi:glutamyl-tRNA synthetase